VTLQDLGSLGEFVAAIATLATLIYLAVQIRQNTRTVRTATYQSVADASIRVPELILANPHLERIYRLGRRDLSQLSDEERPQFRLLVDQFMNVYETMFLQYERGTLDEDFWRARMSGLRGLLSQPGVRSHMEHRRVGPNPAGASGGRVSSFNELIASLLDETTRPAA
jgi:hypothetical protein